MRIQHVSGTVYCMEYEHYVFELKDFVSKTMSRVDITTSIQQGYTYNSDQWYCCAVLFLSYSV